MDYDNLEPANNISRPDFHSEDPLLQDAKVLPFSVEAEQSVLGGLMIADSAWDDVADMVNPADFHRPQHRMIFIQMGKLVEAGEPIDVITLSESLQNNGELDQVGGLPYLAEIAKNTPSAANIRAYAGVVRERANLRSLISAAQQIADTGFNAEGRSSDDLLDEAERKIMQIAEERPKDGGPEGVTPLLKGAVERIDELFNSEETITGVSTGFDKLDEMTSGLQAADLIIVAGRPSMGKTTFAMNLVENAVLDEKNADKPVLVFSMEMPAQSLICG